MTAVVGILNKSAVAIAADSAVTITGSKGRKIFNTANKIFTLSKYQPVGIMIYNSASFMGIPWEVLIKSYREKIEKTSFSTLMEYKEDFIAKLKTQLNIVSEQSQHQYLGSIGLFFFKLFMQEAKAEVNDRLHKITPLQQKDLIKSTLEKHIKDKHYDRWLAEDINEEFKDYISVENFIKSKNDILKNIYSQIYEHLNLHSDIEKMLYEIFYHYLCSNKLVVNMTGLVFVGYGEKELFPSCLPIKVEGAIDGKLRYLDDKASAISINDNMVGAICPFAQTDVIDAFIRGIHRELDATYINSFKTFLARYTLYIEEEAKKAGFDLTSLLNNVNHESMIEELSKSILQVTRSKHVYPTMNTVSILSKEDLAEMAESLIYLTFLKRRISFAEESVGGPVDVAVISKGDGFIWIKRKHYFEPDLNYNFFSNYLKT